MAATKWSQRTVYEVQYREREYHSSWQATANLDNPRFTSRKKAEAGMRLADHSEWLEYRVAVVSTQG
jgi:hypothetical protein